MGGGELCGGGEKGEENTPFSFPFSSPTGFVTMVNQAVSDVMPLFLECLQPYKVSYNPECAHINELMMERYQDTPKGSGARFNIHLSFFFPLTEQSLAMYPKHLIKTYLHCALVCTSASAIL